MVAFDLLTGLYIRAIHWMALISGPHSAKTLPVMHVMPGKSIEG